ncbi:von Willebrand factor type A domain family protein [Acanthocheilonema viteae]
MVLRGTGIFFLRNFLFIMTGSVISSIRNVKAIPIDNSLIDAETIKDCVTNKSVDLILVLDGSGSIGDETFQLLLDFAVHILRRINITEEGSRMGIIQYAETPQLEITLNQYTHSNQMEWAIHRIKYLSGATNTGAALKFTLERGFQEARGGSTPKVAIVVTDGQSQDSVAESAQQLRDAHVMMYAIGVTNLVNVHELHQIAGNPARVLTVESFDELSKTLADSLTWDMCKTEFRPGTPDIICGADRIGVRASTKNPFDGYVFIMDHFHKKECRAGPEQFPDARSIGITIPFTECNIHRYRSLNPRGIFVEMTVVFMFHALFMTKVDQMVKVQCFYMEADKSVSVPMEVSMITTQFREKMYEMPRCEYTLRRGSQDGPIVEYAQLGENVYHRWECHDQADTFGMLVHSCYVDNGFGDRVDILDDTGCGVDNVLLMTPDYDETLRLATKPYHVFKYADRPVLQFQCQITLCLKFDAGCIGLTPPNCPELAHNDVHNHEHGRHEQNEIRRSRSIFGSNTFDIFTPQLYIIDNLPQCSNSSIQFSSFYILGGIISMILNIFLFIIIAIIFLKFRKNDKV